MQVPNESSIHPDTATARATLRAAMAERVARWQAERAGVDVCEVPGCRGDRDGCGLVHARRPREGARSVPRFPGEESDATDATDAPEARWSPSAFLSPVHDERSDRLARLRASGWEPSRFLDGVCARLAVDPRAVAAGSRRHAESRARTAILHAACNGAGVTLRDAARLVGIRDSAAAAGRQRGRAVLTSQGWTLDDVLEWGCPRGG